MDIVAEAVGDPGQAAGVVVAERERGCCGCGVSRGDGFDLAARQVAKAGRAALAAGGFGRGFEAVVAGVVGVGDLKAVGAGFAQDLAAGAVVNIVAQDDAAQGMDAFEAGAVVALARVVRIIVEVGQVIDRAVRARAVDAAELV